MMNSAGSVIENNRTLPYGEMWLASDNGQPTTNDKKFTTYQRDPASGLDYAKNRFDSSANGRFMSVDKGKMAAFAPSTLTDVPTAHAYWLLGPDGRLLHQIGNGSRTAVIEFKKQNGIDG